MTRFVGAALLAGVLTGCTAAQSVVVLLPDDQGRVGRLAVQTAEGEVLLAQPYQRASLDPVGPASNPDSPPPPRKLARTFDRALAAQPKAVGTIDLFTCYYHTDSTRLTPESHKQMTGMLTQLKRPDVAAVYVVGHADRQGSSGYNWNLSRRRAIAMQELLVGAGVEASQIRVTWLGEREPQVATADGVPEPRNRRVRIVVARKGEN